MTFALLVDFLSIHVSHDGNTPARMGFRRLRRRGLLAFRLAAVFCSSVLRGGFVRQEVPFFPYLGAYPLQGRLDDVGMVYESLLGTEWDFTTGFLVGCDAAMRYW